MTDRSPSSAFAQLNVAAHTCTICSTDSAVECHPFYADPTAAQAGCAREHWFHRACINRWRSSGQRRADRCPNCRGAYSSIVDRDGQPVPVVAIGGGPMVGDEDDDVEEDQRQALINDDIVRVAQREHNAPADGDGGAGGSVQREHKQFRMAPLVDTPLPPVPRDLVTAQTMTFDHFTQPMREQFRRSLPAVVDVTARGDRTYRGLISMCDQWINDIQNVNLDDVGECSDPNFSLPRTQISNSGLLARVGAVSRADTKLRAARDALVRDILNVKGALTEKGGQVRNHRQYQQELINVTVTDRLSEAVRRRRRREREAEDEEEGGARRVRRRR